MSNNITTKYTLAIIRQKPPYELNLLLIPDYVTPLIATPTWHTLAELKLL